MDSQKEIKVGIVEDHSLFREGLIKVINMIESHNRYTILFEASNGIDLINKIDKDRLPDIILMDIDMPERDGFDSTVWLKQHYPAVKILVLSMFSSKEAVVRMLRLGANGYLSKDIEVEDMQSALEDLHKRGFYYPDFVAGIMADVIANPSNYINQETVANALSEKEKTFLEYACTDLTYAEIANMMCLSPKTIDGYRENLFDKLKVRTRVSLALYATKNKLVKK